MLRRQQELEYERQRKIELLLRDIQDGVNILQNSFVEGNKLWEQFGHVLVAAHEQQFVPIVEAPKVTPVLEETTIYEELNFEILNEAVDMEKEFIDHGEDNIQVIEVELAEEISPIFVEKEVTCEIIYYPEPTGVFLEEVIEKKILETSEEPIVEETINGVFVPPDFYDSPIIHDHLSLHVFSDFVIEILDTDVDLVDSHFENTLALQVEGAPTSKSAGMIRKLKEIQATHIYVDPFYVHSIPLYFIDTDLISGLAQWSERVILALFTSFQFPVGFHYVGLIKYVGPRLIFDPGRFEDESFTTGRE